MITYNIYTMSGTWLGTVKAKNASRALEIAQKHWPDAVSAYPV